MPSMPRGGRRQLAAARSQSRGSSEPPAHKPLATGSKRKTIRSQSRGSSEPLATGSKTKTTTKRKMKRKKSMSAKRKAKLRSPDRVPATGGIARDRVPKQEAKTSKRAIVEESVSPSSDSKRWRRGRERRPARARVMSSESAPGGDGERASPPSPASGGYDGAEDKSPPSDTSGSYDKTPPPASPAKQSASPPASGGDEDDEDDKRDASPLAKVVPASGGSSSRHSFWSGAVQSKSAGSKAAEKGKWKGKGKGKPGKLASGGSIHPTARYSQQDPQFGGQLLSRDLSEALARWKAWPSHVLLEPDALADFAKRNTSLLEEGHLPEHLIAELPEDPSAAAWREEGWEMPASGGAPAWKFIRELCLRHRGEVRELRGSWEEFDGPLPREMLNPQFHGSFVRVSGEMAMQGRLAAGSWAKKRRIRSPQGKGVWPCGPLFRVRRTLHCQ